MLDNGAEAQVISNYQEPSIDLTCLISCLVQQDSCDAVVFVYDNTMAEEPTSCHMIQVLSDFML